MLVLSRQENQGIRFPGLGVSVEILEVSGNKVKVGVDAPIEVRILRDELMAGDEQREEDSFRARLPTSMRHELRNALEEISLNVRSCLNQMEHEYPQSVDEEIDVEGMFQTIIARIENADQKNCRELQAVGCP